MATTDRDAFLRKANALLLVGRFGFVIGLGPGFQRRIGRGEQVRYLALQALQPRQARPQFAKFACRTGRRGNPVSVGGKGAGPFGVFLAQLV